MTAIDPRTPVIVGAGQVVHRPGDGRFPGPVELAAEALRQAARDSGTGDILLERADTISSVSPVSRHYPDLGSLVAAEIGATPRQTVQSVRFGGDGTQRLINDAAASILAGTADVVLVTGAESVASWNSSARGGVLLDWPEQPETAEPTRSVGSDSDPNTELETAVGLYGPVYVYGLMEMALRAKLGIDRAAYLQRISELWSRFSDVAAENPYAWMPKRHSAETLATPTDDNRQLSSAYNKLHVANLSVDQSAAVIVCSAAAAEAAGVPRDKWVFVHAGAHASDEWFVSERSDLASSPAIATIGSAALAHAGISIDDVAHIDIYSCFPVAVQIAATELGLPIDDPARPLTVTGGLTFGGGPGNNYTGHGVATLIDLLRKNPGGFGLSTGLGWYITKHAIGIYSATPPTRPFVDIDADPDVPRNPRTVEPEYVGPGTVESYLIPYYKGGQAEGVIVSVLTPNGSRLLVRSEDAEIVTAFTVDDPIGAQVQIDGPGSLTLAGASERSTV